MKVPVSDREKQLRYYKYFLREMTPPPPGAVETALSSRLAPEEALHIMDKDRLFEEGYLPGEVGWCIFPDGTATIANLTPMPGVTAEMLDWYFAWHGLEPLRYKIWDPEEHYEAKSLNREQNLNSDLSYKERYWNTCQDVIEGFSGEPAPPLRMMFRNPADVGYSAEKLKTFDGTIICGGGLDDGCFMTHFLRPVPGGSELRSRFWFGWKFVNGQPTKTMPEGSTTETEPMLVLLRHTIREFANLAAILPELFAEERDHF